MRRWGVVITAFYFLLLLVLFGPVLLALAGDVDSSPTSFRSLSSAWIWIIWIAPLVVAQTVLLFIPVDTSRRRLQPRRHVVWSMAAIVFAVGLLTLAAACSLVAAVTGDDFFEISAWWGLLAVILVWGGWSAMFYLYQESISKRLDWAMKWLLTGSILELLIAVPSHIIVRQRDDCSAPGVTAFGIATGIAVMLLAFGPSVLFLYQKRMKRYQRPAQRD
jgi:hypothetical protein